MECSRDEPFSPVNVSGSVPASWFNSAPAYRWISFHPTRLCEVSARSRRIHRRASRNGTALILFAGLADYRCRTRGRTYDPCRALIPLATLPMMIVLFVAIITVHLPKLVQSNFNRLTPLGLTSASRDMKLTCSIWLAFFRCALEDRGRFRLTVGSTGFWEIIVSRARVMRSFTGIFPLVPPALWYVSCRGQSA